MALDLGRVLVDRVDHRVIHVDLGLVHDARLRALTAESMAAREGRLEDDASPEDSRSHLRVHRRRNQGMG